MHADQIAVSPSPTSSAQTTTSRNTEVPSSTRRTRGRLTTYIVVPTTSNRDKASTHITVPVSTMVLPTGSVGMNKVLLGAIFGTLALVVPGVLFMITCVCVKLGRALQVGKSSRDVTPDSRSETSPPISLEFTATSALISTNSSTTLQTETQWDPIVNENSTHAQRDSPIYMHENPSYATLSAEMQPEYETVTRPQEYEVPVSVSSDEAIYAEIH